MPVTAASLALPKTTPPNVRTISSVAKTGPPGSRYSPLLILRFFLLDSQALYVPFSVTLEAERFVDMEGRGFLIPRLVCQLDTKAFCQDYEDRGSQRGQASKSYKRVLQTEISSVIFVDVLFVAQSLSGQFSASHFSFCTTTLSQERGHTSAIPASGSPKEV